MDKRFVIRIVSVLLCVILLMSGALASVFALNIGGEEINILDDITEEVKTKNFKDETVYVIADANGKPDEILVSEWIQNVEEKDDIFDKSDLKDITVEKGNASYTIDKNKMMVWDAQGEDITYTGKTDKKLPVDIIVSYKLDGKNISPDKLAGKSGKLTMTFKYTNNEKEKVKIDGKEEEIFVPFVMLTGALFDNETTKNIRVSNGKVINFGDSTIVGGIALPGLQENFQLDKKEFDIPDTIEITADVTDFELDTTVTIATSDLFSKLDTKSMDNLTKIKSELSKLEDGINQLLDGSSKLYDGLKQLFDKAGELTGAIGQINDGAVKLSDGSTKLNLGSIKLNIGVGDLSDGLDTLAENNEVLNGGSKKVFNTLLSEATKQIRAAGIDCPDLTISNYREVLQKIIDSLAPDKVRKLAEDTARAKIREEVEKNRDTIKAQVTEAVKENVKAQVEAEHGEEILSGVRDAVVKHLGFENYDAYLAAVERGEVDEKVQITVESMISAEYDETVKSYTNQAMETEEVKALIDQTTEDKIDEIIEEQMQSPEVQKEINDAVEKAKEGKEQIEALLKQLNEYNTFDSGLETYTGGVKSAADGSKEIKSGTEDLVSGTSELSIGAILLSQGTNLLNGKTPALASGVGQLKDGAMQLSDGLKKFKSEGIDKIVNLFGNDLSNFITRLRATVDVSKDYKSFAGKTSDMDGKVKFIYTTESIVKAE